MRIKRRARGRAFSLVELLVAVALLSISMAAVTTLWGLARRVTERSRDTAEYYAVARRELERARAVQYVGLFFNGATTGGVVAPVTTTYNQDADAPTVAKPAVYEAVSTFTRRQTSAEDPQRQLGVQVIDVYLLPRAVGDTPVYSTSTFFAIGGV